MAMHQITLGESFGLVLFCEERLLKDADDSSGGSPGELVLFLHGLGCDHSSFAGAWAEGGFAGYSLLVPDLPGHGASGALEDLTYRLQDHAEIILRLLAQVPFERLHIIGHSMGGAIGLMLAERGDLPLASFISVEGNLLEHDCGILSRRAAETTEELFVSDKFVKLLEKASRAEAADTRGWAKMAEHTDAYAFHRSAVSLVEWSDSGCLYEMFAALAVPKVYIYGERSANAEVIARLDGVHKIEIGDAGHFLTTDQSELFHETVARIIANG